MEVPTVPAWEFYVISTDELNRHFPTAKTISLRDVQASAARCGFDQLKRTADACLNEIACGAQA